MITPRMDRITDLIANIAAWIFLNIFVSAAIALFWIAVAIFLACIFIGMPISIIKYLFW
jgi:hypothetical protein